MSGGNRVNGKGRGSVTKYALGKVLTCVFLATGIDDTEFTSKLMRKKGGCPCGLVQAAE